MTTPISYSEFQRRFTAASNELWGQPVVLDPKTGEPTSAENVRCAHVFVRHGITDFVLQWSAEKRTFLMAPMPSPLNVTYDDRPIWEGGGPRFSR